MITFAKSFSLKQKDFQSGKMVSPPREFWVQCDCCGKMIVQGVVMTNGDKIGNDCHEVVRRTPSELAKNGNANELFRIFGTKTVAQEYALRCAAN